MDEIERVVNQIASQDIHQKKTHGEHIEDFDDPDEARAFMSYVRAGDIFNVNKMLKTGFQGIDGQDEAHEDTSLHIAVRAGNLEMLRLLLDYNAKPNLQNRSGDAPIHQVLVRAPRHTMCTARESSLCPHCCT